jgi:hypothetical protein
MGREVRLYSGMIMTFVFDKMSIRMKFQKITYTPLWDAFPCLQEERLGGIL